MHSSHKTHKLESSHQCYTQLFVGWSISINIILNDIFSTLSHGFKSTILKTISVTQFQYFERLPVILLQTSYSKK